MASYSLVNIHTSTISAGSSGAGVSLAEQPWHAWHGLTSWGPEEEHLLWMTKVHLLQRVVLGRLHILLLCGDNEGLQQP